MSLKHERDFEWPDDAFTLPMDADLNADPITVWWIDSLWGDDGHYAVWYAPELGGAPVEDGLTMGRARRRALKLQDEYGAPIIETVQR